MHWVVPISLMPSENDSNGCCIEGLAVKPNKDRNMYNLTMYVNKVRDTRYTRSAYPTERLSTFPEHVNAHYSCQI